MEQHESKESEGLSPRSGEVPPEQNEDAATVSDDPVVLADGVDAQADTPVVEEAPPAKKRRGLKSWVEARAKGVVSRLYETRADDIEERARRAVGSAYKDSADDLEERAVRAMRQALHHEADRIKEAIEHGVAVKKREVRLSLLVLVTASLLYLALYWATHQGPAS